MVIVTGKIMGTKHYKWGQDSGNQQLMTWLRSGQMEGPGQYFLQLNPDSQWAGLEGHFLESVEYAWLCGS